MSKWLPVGIALFGAAAMFAQPRPGGGPGYGAGLPAGARDYGLGFGNVVFPGGVSPLRPPSNLGFAQRLGATVGGNGYTGAPSFGGGGVYNGYGLGRRTVVLPVPVYVGGYYGYYAPSADTQPDVTVATQPATGQQPVVINQYFGTAPPAQDQSASGSSLRSYEAPLPNMNAETPADTSGPKANIYLIAFKDQNIQAAYAAWVEGSKLHYVTVQGSHNTATLDVIDREMTDRLNRERGLESPLSIQAR